MSALDRWVVDAAAALGVPATDVPADVRRRLLDLAEALREPCGATAGTMTGFVLGLAAGRGIAPAVALSTLEDLLDSRGEPDEPAGGVPGPPAPGSDTTVTAARESRADEPDA